MIDILQWCVVLSEKRLSILWLKDFDRLEVMIDFNGMSTCLGWLHAKRLGISFIVLLYWLYLCTCFLREVFCTQSDKIWIILNRFIWSRDGTLTGTTTPGQSELGSNANKEGLQNCNLTIKCCFVSYTGYPFGEFLPLCREYSVF